MTCMRYTDFEQNFSATSNKGFKHNGKKLLNASLDSCSITFINVKLIKSPAKFYGCPVQESVLSLTSCRVGECPCW